MKWTVVLLNHCKRQAIICQAWDYCSVKIWAILVFLSFKKCCKCYAVDLTCASFVFKLILYIIGLNSVSVLFVCMVKRLNVSTMQACVCVSGLTPCHYWWYTSIGCISGLTHMTYSTLLLIVSVDWLHVHAISDGTLVLIVSVDWLHVISDGTRVLSVSVDCPHVNSDGTLVLIVYCRCVWQWWQACIDCVFVNAYTVAKSQYVGK